MSDLPDASWGDAETPLPDWRQAAPPEIDPDDELLPETPPDVVEALGFDPLDEAQDEELAAIEDEIAEIEGMIGEDC